MDLDSQIEFLISCGCKVQGTKLPDFELVPTFFKLIYITKAVAVSDEQMTDVSSEGWELLAPRTKGPEPT